MSIAVQLKTIDKVTAIVTQLKAKYARKRNVAGELTKLLEALHKLHTYLQNLDQLKPNYNTNHVQTYMRAIQLHVDLLHATLLPVDSKKLEKAVKVLAVIMKFHPVKYSYISYAIAWLSELCYFI